MTQAMNFDVGARDTASPVLLRIAAAAEKLTEQLKQLDRTRSNPTITLDAADAKRDAAEVRRDLAAVRNVNAKLKINVSGNTAVANVAAKMNALRDVNVGVDVRLGDSETKLDRLATKMIALRAMSPLKLKVEVDDQATGDLAAIQAAATALAGASPTIRVDAATAAALSQLGAVAAALGALGTGSTTVRVVLDQLTFLGQLARIQGELRALSGGDIEINADTRRLMEELARARVALADLAQQAPSVVVDADTALARHRIQQLEEELARIAGRQYRARVDVDVDKGALSRIAQFGTALIGIGAAGGLAAAGAGTATAAIASLAGSLASLAGLTPVLVGGLAAAGAAGATLKVGMQGVGDALKEADPSKFAESLKGLSPAAAAFVTAIRSMKAGFDSLQLGVQQNLFVGLGDQVKLLGNTYLPTLKSGMGGIATEFNLVGKSVLGFATSAATVRDVNTIFRDTTASMAAARPAATNLLSVFRDLAAVGTGSLPKLASGFADATGKLAAFTAASRESGRMQEWITNATNTLKQLGSIAGNVGSALGSVFTAAKASGADFLSTLDRVTATLANLLKSAQGQSALIAFFRDSRAAVDALLPGLTSLGTAALKFIQAFSETGALQAAGAALTKLAQAVAPLGASLGELAGNALRNIAAGASVAAAALGPIVTAINGVLKALGPVAPAVLGMVVAFKALTGVNVAVTALGASLAAMAGRVAGLPGPVAGIATAFSRIGTAIPIAGVALVGIGAIIEAAGAKSRETAAQIGALSDSLDKFTGAATQATIAQRAKQLADDGTLESVKKLGVSTNDYVKAALGVPGALEAVNGQLNRHNEQVLAASDTYRKWAPQLSGIGISLADVSAAASGNSEAMGRVQAALAAIQNTTDKSTFGKVVGDLLQMGEGSKKLAQELGITSGQFAQMQEKTRLASEAAGDFASKLDYLKDGFGGLQGGVAPTEQLRAGLQGLSAAAAEGAKKAGEIGASIGGVAAGGVKAAQAMQASREAFLQAADAAGIGANAANQLADSVGLIPEAARINFETNAAGVAAELNVIGQQVKAVPDQKSVTVNLLSDEAAAKLEAFGLNVEKLPNGQSTIDLHDETARAKFDAFVQLTSTTVGKMLLDMEPGKAIAVLNDVLRQAGSSTGIVSLDGDPKLVEGKIEQSVKLADGSTGTIRIDGNPDPATGKVTATIRYADGSTGTVTINARDLATPVIDKLKQPTSSTHTIRVVTTQVGPEYQDGGRTVLGAQGMIVQPMAAGGLLRRAAQHAQLMASGGHLTPMSSRIARVVPPNTWRVIGDRVTDDEAFIPINQSARSMSILHATAQRMGQAIAPQAAGGMTSWPSTQPMPSYAATRNTNTDAQQLAAAIVAPLRRDLRDLVKTLTERTTQITVEDRSGDPVQTARATQLAIRTS